VPPLAACARSLHSAPGRERTRRTAGTEYYRYEDNCGLLPIMTVLPRNRRTSSVPHSNGLGACLRSAFRNAQLFRNNTWATLDEALAPATLVAALCMMRQQGNTAARYLAPLAVFDRSTGGSATHRGPRAATGGKGHGAEETPMQTAISGGRSERPTGLWQPRLAKTHDVPNKGGAKTILATMKPPSTIDWVPRQ
jgi:hypothetical protein